MFADLSSDTETTRVLSGEYLTPQTWSTCSVKVCRHFRSDVLQILTVLSEEDDAKYLPSGENATERTHEAWPESVPAISG